MQGVGIWRIELKCYNYFAGAGFAEIYGNTSSNGLNHSLHLLVLCRNTIAGIL